MLCIEPEMRKGARECLKRSLLLPNGSPDTWKTRVGKEAEWQEGDSQDREQEEEESGESETVIFLGKRNSVAEHGTKAVAPDPEMDDDIPPYQPDSRLSEGWSVTASVRELYRSGAPSPSTLSSHHTELREILSKIFDPESSLFPGSTSAILELSVDTARGLPAFFGYSAKEEKGHLRISDGKAEEAILQLKKIVDECEVPIQSIVEDCIPPLEKMLAFDDRALGQFMAEHRGVDNMFDISSIKDWERAPDQQRKELMRRLADAAQPILASHTLDVSQLIAKLTSISKEGEIPVREYGILPSSPSPPVTRSETQSPDPWASMGYEIRCYDWLIDAGGQPMCSLETLEDVYKSPTAYMEMLGPWQGDFAGMNLDDTRVFSLQLDRWKEFRRWQRDNRGDDSAAEDTFAAFVDERRTYFKYNGIESGITTRPDFEEIMARIWEGEKAHRDYLRERAREVPQGSFTEYAEGAQRRLARHGFSQPFQLLEDPKQQDKRVTWIEYLEFECWWLDEYTRCWEIRKKRLNGAKEERWEDRRAKKRAVNQRLRVQWVLSKMSGAEEALNPPKAVPDGAAKTTSIIGATRKRKRDDDEDENTGVTTDESAEAATKRQKQGKPDEPDELGAAQQAATPAITDALES
ncbi:hypothetical protein ONZ43_g5086 [Nemania bipapillata]|uniref:Uncharacterized protein n=1 Tax=Nemania bipapillata TaxID=110536 RepID=A0ACC2IF33_9PEZI|nr:hypothetical protein ONZ43_g5086 [Nemania bipapillata]